MQLYFHHSIQTHLTIAFIKDKIEIECTDRATLKAIHMEKNTLLRIPSNLHLFPFISNIILPPEKLTKLTKNDQVRLGREETNRFIH